jgi:N-acetylneuraminic acid mutarotase
VYAIGGASNQDAAETALSVVQMYDPATDKWTAVASLPTPRALIMSGVDSFAGHILVGGGETAYNVPTDQITAYDDATNTWTQLTPIPKKRTSGVLKDLGNELIFTMGHPGFNNDTWIGTFS